MSRFDLVRRWLIVVHASLLTLSVGQVQGLENNSPVFGRFEVDLLSEPESLHGSLDDWGKSFDKGERQWAVTIAESGIRYRGFEVSLLQRAHLDLRIHKDLAEFYGRIARKESLTPGATIPLDLQVESFTAEGLRLGYRTAGRQWTLGGGLSYLKAEKLISGGIHGEISSTSQGDYDLDAFVDYSYYRDAIFDRPLQAEPEGQGWALDLAGAWRIGEHWRISASAEDLFARIYWHNAPYTRARGHTDRKTYDENGYAVFKPLISGIEGFHSRYTQELTPRYRARLEYSKGNWNAAVHGRHQFDLPLGGLGVGYQVPDGQSLKLIYWPEIKATAIHFGFGRLDAQLTTDSTDRESARRVILSLRYGIPF